MILCYIASLEGIQYNSLKQLKLKMYMQGLSTQKRALTKTNHGVENLKNCNYIAFVLLG